MNADASAICPVRWAWRAHPPGSRAEAQARAWLAAQLGVAPEALPLGRDARNRPALALPGFDCNWSHSGGHLLLGLGTGVRVGVDVERVRARPRAVELARRFFAGEEAEAIARLPAGAVRDLAFARLWCLKEALLKAHGHGLSFGLDRAVFAAPPEACRVLRLDPRLGSPERWQVRALDAPEGYVAAIAWRR